MTTRDLYYRRRCDPPAGGILVVLIDLIVSASRMLYANSISVRCRLAFISVLFLALNTALAQPSAPPQQREPHALGCVAGSCQLVAGLSSDQCTNDVECRHDECDSEMSCSEVLTPGENLCSSDKDCSHSECSDLYCVKVSGDGKDLCDSDYECGHNRCVNGMCGRTSSRGLDECAADDDCKRKKCTGIGQCQLLFEVGIDECSSGEDCKSSRCDGDGTCTWSSAPGVSECYADDTCSYRDCVGGFCTVIPGSSVIPDMCQTDDQCGHYTCDGATCKHVTHSGVTSCFTNDDCGFKVCAGIGACKRIFGEGQDQCSNDSDCVPGTYHSDSEASQLRLQQDLLEHHENTLALKDPAFSSTDSLTRIGDGDAPVKVYMFQDLTCGMCKRSWDKIRPVLQELYVESGKVQLILKDAPLRVHPQKEETLRAMAAQCAGRRGNEYYIRTLDLIYANWNEDVFPLMLKQSWLQEKRAFVQCVEEHLPLEEIYLTKAIGKELGVIGTPTFFVNGIRVNGARIGALSQAIERALVELQG